MTFRGRVEVVRHGGDMSQTGPRISGGALRPGLIYLLIHDMRYARSDSVQLGVQPLAGT